MNKTKGKLIAKRELVCEECGDNLAVEVWGRRGLCRACLNPDPSDDYLHEQFNYWTGQGSSSSFAPALDGSAVKEQR